MSPSLLSTLLGRIDVYLLDQVLKGNIDLDRPILDAGCGGGRNCVYFMQQGANVYGVDQQAEAIISIRELAAYLNYPHPDRFSQQAVERLDFPDASFGSVICNAVLHFANDEAHFRAMVEQMWRVLAPEGILFVRTATLAGMEEQVASLEERPGWYHLPDGTARFLISMEALEALTDELDGTLVQPLRSVLVHQMRSMGTWVLQK